MNNAYIKNIGIGLILMTGVLGCGCGRTEENSDSDQARSLYEQSVKLTRLYTDSMAQAKDSASVNRLALAYDKALTNLNYEYGSEIDPAISEGENDTLVNLTLRYISIKDSVLSRLKHTHLAVDTVEVEQEGVGAGSN